MIIKNEILEQFKNLFITIEEIGVPNSYEMFNAETASGQMIQIEPENVIVLLTKYKNNEIDKKRLLEWVNTVMFVDNLFVYNENFLFCLISVMAMLEELDEGDNELTDKVIEKYIYALENNIEIDYNYFKN